MSFQGIGRGQGNPRGKTNNQTNKQFLSQLDVKVLSDELLTISFENFVDPVFSLSGVQLHFNFVFLLVTSSQPVS